MITTSPGIGHIFPQIPTAWALRAAGHEVLFAAPSNTERVADAGLLAVDPAPGFDFRALFMGFIAEHGEGAQQAGLDFVSRLFAQVSAPSVDEVVRLATDWRQDLMISGPLEGAAGVASAVLGVPNVVHGIGPGQDLGLATGVARELAETYQRFRVEHTPAAALLDISPPSMRAPGAAGIPLRCVPFNGGGVLEAWLTRPRTRPRITVTLGTVVPLTAGISAIERLTRAAAEVDAEFVLALGGADPSPLGDLPANVRVVGWIPLNALLSASDAVVHHGGAGTALTALAAGIPQLVLPQGADQFLNADAVARTGAGQRVTAEDLDAARLTDLLTDTGKRSAATKIADELAAQPSPADVVPQLVALAR
ncbi:MAG TPA: nucleotide disphospho-sugar-binding domain-containing protein [Pseudonocardiaceae bacterium]|nr:nucleotide disphospho-sugar-binding domain-containing protein [Pseudonocardiaceae bacterium]